ncbi:alpha/beta fold hydrolase [Ruegeria sp. Ofav3-42]|uniref:alpha/beta fold hydrolase n=1 Tax=Ruegeria sp. Ofav3-42 TaxID=2917759 RepID=UPI001EF40943|nr:alpha/beta hydrolase [Ruegeria sp. Ofav3-42]MCG7518614.1 alpha/beta hydrolase [Ruegeria sp. Ofav3-42]
MAFFTTSDDRRIYFEDTGAGKPVLCLAGLTRNSRDFSFLAPHLIDMRMIAMDYRGRGQSDHDPDYMNYNVNRESHDAIELLDHLGLDRVNVIGTSRGGLIAMALAASHPDRLSSVVLNDVGPVLDPSGIIKIMEYVGKPPVSGTYDQAAQALQHVMEPHFPGVPLERWRQQAEIQFEETSDGLALRYDPALRTALLEQATAGGTPDLWMFFEALQGIPTGVVRGANSDVLGKDTLTEMHNRHPGLISAEIPDRGHAPFLDEPQSLELIHKVLNAT